MRSGQHEVKHGVHLTRLVNMIQSLFEYCSPQMAALLADVAHIAV